MSDYKDKHEDWQPGHRNTQTSVEQRKVDTLTAFKQRLNAEAPTAVADPIEDPEHRFLRGSQFQQAQEKLGPQGLLTTREQLEAEARAIRDAQAKVYAQSIPTRNYPADALVGIGGGPTRATILPYDAKARKDFPIASGLLDYFPDALCEVARLSKLANDQHNPGEEVHWSRGKSSDHADTLGRHLLQRGTIDTDRIRHSTKVAWRALAMLQEELENAHQCECHRYANAVCAICQRVS